MSDPEESIGSDGNTLDASLQSAGKAVGVVSKIIEVAEKNDDAKEAGKSLARTARTLATTIEVCLLPFTAISSGYERARRYFSSDFSDEVSRKLEGVPNDCVIEPKPGIVAPAIQNLGYSIDEPDLKEMYLNLIAQAMDGREQANTHPSYVEIVRQLSSMDARFLKTCLKPYQTIPIACLNAESAGRVGGTELFRHVIDLSNCSDFPKYFNYVPALENFSRLGVVDIDYTRWMTSDDAYNWVKETPYYGAAQQLAVQQRGKGATIKVSKGILTFTAFGRNFFRAVT